MMVIELIAVDDGSEGDTLERLTRFDDPRLTIHPQENRGAHAALNRVDPGAAPDDAGP